MPVAPSVVLGCNVRIIHPELVVIYGCTIGDEVLIGPFVEIQVGCVIGHRCKISSHSFICGGVVLEEEVMIGHGVTFTRETGTGETDPAVITVDQSAALARTLLGKGEPSDEWRIEPTRVGRGAVIGAGSTILGGVRIGAGAQIGAGSVIMADVPAGAAVSAKPDRARTAEANENSPLPGPLGVQLGHQPDGK